MGAPLPELKTLAKSILTVVGTLGGLLYLLERLQHLVAGFRNRPHLAVRILRETLNRTPLVEFEAQNLGAAPIALEPWIELTGFWILGGEFHRWRFRFEFAATADRSLEPHKPKRISAVGEADQDVFPFLWYRAYTFRATRGRPCRVYLRHIDGPELSWLRFRWEVTRLRIPWTRDALLKRVRARTEM
jgi:hypothetical protein